jgi:ATP-dependent DNA helicase RecG
MSLNLHITKIKKAIQLEEVAQFIDILGQTEPFSRFMQRSFRLLHLDHKITVAAELSKKYEIYKTMDLPGRMELVKATKRTLNDLNIEDLAVLNQSEATKWQNRPKQPLSEIDIKWVPGVGEALSKIIKRLGIHTVQDLLFYWPRQHLNFSQRVPIRDLKVGMEATVIGLISKVNAFQSPRNPNLSILDLRISDASGTLSLHKFMAGRSNKFLLEGHKKQFPVGALVMVSGRAQFSKQTRYQLTNFSLQVIDENAETKTENNVEALDIGRLVPVYGLTDGLSQARLRKIIFNCLERFAEQLEETLPQELLAEKNFMDFSQAVKQMHFPDSEAQLEKAKERIIFEEFFLMQLPLAIRRHQNNQLRVSVSERELQIKPTGPVHKLREVLPFNLTGAQERVLSEILNDLKQNKPMSRLVQGDVGSGKTVVALLTMLVAVENGKQAAIMAPTEILAEQHYRKFQELLTAIGVKVALLIGSQKAAERREVLTGLANGQVQIVVGTHALIQDGVEFANLGLAVIDEQHRFGVRQRDVLKRKGEDEPVDCLFMTATPIPRTLALAMYGNLDLSEIDELPPGRKPIRTRIVDASNRKAAHEFVKKQIAEGRQAYIVYPLIEESEALSAKAVTEEAIKLKKIYEDYQVGIVHGRLTVDEKEDVMSKFRSNEVQILVGTTVIEVGVDIPNASVMIIENAERFGLSQLHQLRGRVGRGSSQSYCLLFADSKSVGTLERLRVMEETENGFVIAQKDLQIRGPGELMGTRQSGLSDFGLECLSSHSGTLESAREWAHKIVEADPLLKQAPATMRKRIEDLKHKASLLESG